MNNNVGVYEVAYVYDSNNYKCKMRGTQRYMNFMQRCQRGTNTILSVKG